MYFVWFPIYVLFFHILRGTRSLCMITENLGASFLLMLLDFGVPIGLSWLALYLDILQWSRGILSFRIKYNAKRFPGQPSTLPQMSLPYPRWRVIWISILIRSRVPPWCNSPGDISPRFCWYCQSYFPT